MDGDPLLEMGEEQVWSVVAAPGLKTPGTKPVSAFPVGAAGRRHGESGSEERGHGSGQKPRAQNNSNNRQHAVLYTGLVKFSQYEQPF